MALWYSARALTIKPNQRHHCKQVQRFVKGASGTGRDLGVDEDDDDDEDEEAQLQRDADNNDKDLTLTELVAKATEAAQEAAKHSSISGGSGKTVPFFRGEKVV